MRNAALAEQTITIQRSARKKHNLPGMESLVAHWTVTADLLPDNKIVRKKRQIPENRISYNQ